LYEVQKGLPGTRYGQEAPAWGSEVDFMKEDTRRLLRLVGFASTIGLTLVLSTVIGLAVGIWLDKVFDTGPWLTLIFLVLGIAAGFRNFYHFMSKSNRQ
jgi:ATP synthase protein I